MPLSPEQEAYNQSQIIDWNIFYNSLSADNISKMHGVLNGTGINGENANWENSSYKEATGFFKTYDDLYNQFNEHLADGDISELILAIKSDLDSNGEVIIDGKTLNIGSFNTPGTTDISDFFATPADQFNPLEYTFETPQSIALLHFARNLIMDDQDISYLELIRNADQYIRIEDAKNEFHKLDNSDLGISGNTYNVKWTSSDGLSEYIFQSNFANVDDVVNAGSYNFFAPTTGTDGYNHLQLDVFTWIAFGNLYGDISTVSDRGYDGVKSSLPDRFDTWLSFNFSDETMDQNHAILYAEDARFHIVSGSGNDFFLSGSQDDHFNGGEGNDTVSYSLSDSGISVNLRLGQGYDGYAAYDNHFEQLISIENIVGSNHTDVIVGSADANKLEGMGGDDSIAGEGGDDTLLGGAGDDYLEGGDGTDTAVFTGNYSQYTVTTNDDGSVSVASRNSAELGTDTLVGVEKLQFSDASVSITNTAITTDSTPVLVGNPFLVNTHTSGDQEYPDITQLLGGGFVATWQSYNQDGYSWGIYGQRFDADGNQVGDEFRVNSQNRSDERPSIVGLDDGGFMIVWSYYSSNSSRIYQVRGQKYDADGNTIGDELLISTSDSISKQNPKIAAGDDGSITITWVQNGDIFARSFDGSGNPTNDPTQVNQFPSGWQQDAEITSLNNGSYVVVWHSPEQDNDQTGYSSGGIFGRVINADGSMSSDEFQINTYTSGRQDTPTITSTENGGFIVVWDSPSGTTLRIFDSEGEPVSPEILVSEVNSAYEIFPEVSVLSDGSFVVAWDHGQIFGQRFDADGNKMGEVFVIRTEAASPYDGVSISALDDGNFVVVTSDWNNADGSGTGSFATIFSVASGVEVETTTVHYNSGRTVIHERIEGVLIETEVRDDGASHAWATYTDVFDSNGLRVSRNMTYDDGREAETVYTDGVRSSRSVTDSDDAHAWSTIEQSFNADGVRTSQSNFYDDGRELDITYIDGVRAVSEMYDMEDAHAWDYQKTTFTSDNKPSQKTIDYDDGRKLITEYEGGVRSSSVVTDINDVFAWSSVEKTFLSDGKNLDEQTKTYDDGRVLVIDYVGGDRSSQTMTDVNDVHSWESITTLFYDDEFIFSDTPVERTHIYDDGRELVTDYIDGVRSQSVMTDVDDVKSWDHYTIDYDAEGNKISRTMVYDDGREVFTSYVDDFMI